MLRIACAFLALLIHQAVFGQQMSHPVTASRDDVSGTPRPFLTAPDTVNILAMMVQFQADNDEGTSGNGQFDLSPATEPIIDSPPHDGQYFRDHLSFVENYFEKASNEKQVIRWTLLDTVYTLAKGMGEYSPQRGESNIKLAELARDAWQLVDLSDMVVSYAGYDCFVVFHAGTGHDIDLASLLGFDPTPRDIPSIFMGPAAFREAFGDDYPGILVNGGQDTIRNSAILPETENRLLPGISGDVLLELSFNGLLCASVGSYLGLPDLFNTANGRSAIGRFGLMDGQAIFSFAGLFPPEPSAWEKYWLGWTTPIVPGQGESRIQIPAVGLASSDSVYRLPVSATEYFLAENRYRDPAGNGQTITYVHNGTTQTRTFLRDTVGFNAFDVSALSGVVTDVEDLDWSLPGGIDEDGNILNGGLLLWHVDEVVIQAEIGTNTVNADPDLRGVDLEEADGSQDIGEDYGFLSPGSGSEEGTPLDFWFNGNPAPVYLNEFSDRSHPPSRTNAGANSHVTIRDIDSAGVRMAATVLMGDEQASLLPGFPRSAGEYLPGPSVSLGVIGSGAEAVVLTSTGRVVPGQTLEGVVTVTDLPGKVFAWTPGGSPAVPGSHADGHFMEGMTPQGDALLETAAAVHDLNGDGVAEIVVGQGGLSSGATGSGQPVAALRAVSQIDSDGDSLAENFFSINVAKRLTTPPVVGTSMIAVGATEGMVYLATFDGAILDSLAPSAPTADSVVGVSRYRDLDGFVVARSDGMVTSVLIDPRGNLDGGRDLGSSPSGPVVMGQSGNGDWLMAVATTDGFLHLMDELYQDLPGFPVSTGAPCTAPPALADIDADGVLDVILFSGNKVFAFHHNGALLDNYPVTINTSVPIASSPVVADADGDLDVDIIAVAVNGLVAAYDRNGRMAGGFPLQAGSGMQSVAAIRIMGPSLTSVEIGLVVASSAGSVVAWKTGSVPVPLAAELFPWPQFQKDGSHTGLADVPAAGTQVSTEFFPEGRVYNWPNPVYDGTTYLRFFVKEDAAVSVTIFDLAGDLVAELSGRAVGGVDNEIPWDVSGIQSGVYFARVEAAGATGSGSAIVKVAVVK